LFFSQNLPICSDKKQYFLQNSRAFQERDFLKNVFNNSEDNFHIYSFADYGYFGEVIIKTKGNKKKFANLQ
jgi:hypothetical protein